MPKIRIGTDIMFRIRVHGNGFHIFDKPIQQVIPLLMSKGSCGCNTKHTPSTTSTNQCCGHNMPSVTHMLRSDMAQIVNKQELIIDALFLGEEQRNTGPMCIQLTWVEGGLGSTRTEQLRFTIDFHEVVEMIGRCETPDLTGVRNENGRLVIDLDWQFEGVGNVHNGGLSFTAKHESDEMASVGDGFMSAHINGSFADIQTTGDTISTPYIASDSMLQFRCPVIRSYSNTAHGFVISLVRFFSGVFNLKYTLGAVHPSTITDKNGVDIDNIPWTILQRPGLTIPLTKEDLQAYINVIKMNGSMSSMTQMTPAGFFQFYASLIEDLFTFIHTDSLYIRYTRDVTFQTEDGDFTIPVQILHYSDNQRIND